VRTNALNNEELNHPGVHALLLEGVQRVLPPALKDQVLPQFFADSSRKHEWSNKQMLHAVRRTQDPLSRAGAGM